MQAIFGMLMMFIGAASAQVSSVSVWYKCLASEDIKVHCSAEGDDLTYSWTSDFNTISQLENGTSTLTLNKGHHGNVTCYVKNHVSQSHNTTVLQPCPEPTTRRPSVSQQATTSQALTVVENDTKLFIGFKKVNVLTHDGIGAGSGHLPSVVHYHLLCLAIFTKLITGSCTLPPVHPDAPNYHRVIRTFLKVAKGQPVLKVCSVKGEKETLCPCGAPVLLSKSSDRQDPATGLLFQDPVVCKFNKSDQCYVALGEPLHLQIPPADAFNLLMRDKTSADRTIIRFRKNSLVFLENLPRWQFVKENNTMILISAERSDSGTYSLETIDAGGALTGSYTLQLHTEAQVSSVSVWYKCLASEDIKVHCSAEGDDLTYSWTYDFKPHLENGTSTHTLNKEYRGNVTCYVKNHVSQSHNTTELQPCPVTLSTQSNNGFRVFVSVWLFEIIILLSLLVGAFYIYTRIYMKQRIIKSKAFIYTNMKRSGSSVNLVWEEKMKLLEDALLHASNHPP
ncbi:hypothetical protein C0J50_2608 [Silurus asotus]|uniref:Ig-like domain-containing protein n=1 Tax=Silurus asotus TaxID=30991 RepID=A0AAD5B5G3_SILAS|nr:hypothetical protein C0J50_2608 [Silurus asotus]